MCNGGGTDGKGLGDEEAHGEMGRSLDILIIGGGILQAVACPLYLSQRTAALRIVSRSRLHLFSSTKLLKRRNLGIQAI